MIDVSDGADVNMRFAADESLLLGRSSVASPLLRRGNEETLRQGSLDTLFWRRGMKWKSTVADAMVVSPWIGLNAVLNSSKIHALSLVARPQRLNP